MPAGTQLISAQCRKNSAQIPASPLDAATDHASTLTVRVHHEQRPVHVAHVMDTDTAAGGGCLWTTPTSKAYPTAPPPS